MTPYSVEALPSGSPNPRPDAGRRGAVDAGALAAVLDDFAATVAGDFSIDDILRQLAEAATRVLDVDGAGVIVPQRSGFLRLAFSTPGVVSEVEQVQERLQDGPCRDCHASGAVVSVADLVVDGNWPEFQNEAVAAGLRAVVALPLRARGRSWGVLDVYRSTPVTLDEAELVAAQTLANLATSYLVVTADRDAARQAQELAAYRSMHDPLTGLPVRWVFLEQLAHALARLSRHPGNLGVLFIDLDGLKYVNDTFGHIAGDELITTFASRVRAVLRPSDVIARAGGDEFLVLLEDVAGVNDAVTVARRVLDQVSVPYLTDGETIRPSASVGVAMSSSAEDSGDTLISHADAAMYRAKQAGRGRVEVFSAAAYAADRAAATEQEELAVSLRSALRAGQLELHYQPIIDLTAYEAGAGKSAAGHASPSYAVEALVRWRHPTRGLLPAGAFIETAERSGLMVELGAWALGTACRQLAEWDSLLAHRAPGRVFVNVSVGELARAGLADLVRQTLADAGVDASRLTLEITETGLLTEPHAVALSARSLRELGCQLAIDDFGTGYSSLSRLVQIPASTLKVDQSFTHDLRTNPDALAVVSAVLLLGRSLRRTVIVEGVEDAATLRTLQELGCTHVQGFHLARPQPADDITAGLQRA